MLRYWYAFTSGELSPWLTHGVLLGGAVAAEIAVAIGIVLETPKEKTLGEKFGVALVLGGVLVSAIFTIALFVFDEGISRGQQDKIIVLETQLAPRVLTKDQVDELHALRGKVPALSFMASSDKEPAFFSAQLQAIMVDDDGIAVTPYPAPAGVTWVGTLICLPKPGNGDRSGDALLFETLAKIGPKPGTCSFDELGLPIREDIPLVIVGERPFVFSDTQNPGAIRFKMYPGFGKQKK